MELSDFKGVGPTRLTLLRAMGICSLRDLLYHLPIRYEDQTTVTPCAAAQAGTTVLLEGRISAPPKINRFKGISRVNAALADATGSLPLSWYNQPWMMQQLKAGQPLMLYGRIGDAAGRRVMQNPRVVTEKGIKPVYGALKDYPPKSFHSLMMQAVKYAAEVQETLPETLCVRHGVTPLAFALKHAHLPQDMDALKAARRRLAFEQLLLYMTAVQSSRSAEQQAEPIPSTEAELQAWWSGCGFAPTLAQQRVLREIAEDLRKPVAMSRLVQGDVGCGKTAIAFGAMALCVRAGFQAAMMAPTDILARQHFENAKALLGSKGISCGLLTGSLTAAERKRAHAAIASGAWQVVFGTHALISEGVAYQHLGLVITDEQHRFGVRQRSHLQNKGEAASVKPHVLVMSATPIPRTLALMLYGDLSLSVVDELPPGRKPVQTRLVPPEKRAGLYSFVHARVKAGEQAYIVCPLVEESEDANELKSVKETFAELSGGVLSSLRVGLTWGGQKPDQKAETLRAFAAGELDVLVSTTVIEVGVNVPNASIMVIENAGRYGLSQLHQLRGRVGRGSQESWCFLVGKPTERLSVMTQTNDGFVIAQKDLELRGPGDLLGTRQSGEAMADFLLDGDLHLLEETAATVRELRECPVYAAEYAAVSAVAQAMYVEPIARN